MRRLARGSKNIPLLEQAATDSFALFKSQNRAPLATAVAAENQF
jgi:hypothetical protein